MAYSDPQSVTVDEATISLPRTGSTGNTGTFTSADQRYKLAISHNAGKRRADIARLEFADIVQNPLVPSQNYVVDAAVTLTINRPINGMSAEQAVDLAEALVAWLTVPGNVTKLVGGEN